MIIPALKAIDKAGEQMKKNIPTLMSFNVWD